MLNRPIYIITGLMGSGKSTVSNLLRLRHYEVLNMDEVAKTIAENNPEMILSLLRHFGKDAITDEGKPDFDYLKKIYFSPGYDTARQNYESDLDSYINIKHEWENYIDKDANGVPLFVEIPAFGKKRFERVAMAFLGHINAVIFVKSSEEVRMKRLKEIRHMTDDEIKLRERLQCDLHKPGNLPTFLSHPYLLENNGTNEELYDNLTELLESKDFFRLTDKEKIFQSYISKMPGYVMDNAMCYVYYNSTGCGSCPCPCKHSNKHFEETVKSQLNRSTDEKDS